MLSEEFISLNENYNIIEANKLVYRDHFLPLLIHKANLYSWLLRLQDNPDKNLGNIVNAVKSAFHIVGVTNPSENLINDFTSDINELIHKKPILKKDYDSLEEKQRQNLQSMTIKKIFKQQFFQVFLRTCQVMIINQTENDRDSIIKKFLEERLRIIKILYPAVRHDENFAHKLLEIFKTSILYNYSSNYAILLQKLDFVLNSMVIKKCSPEILFEDFLAEVNVTYKSYIPEITDAFDRFKLGVRELEIFTKALDKIVVKPALPIKSILSSISFLSAVSLWMGITPTPLFILNGVLWSAGVYYDYSYNKPQIRDISPWYFRDINDKYLGLLTFRRVVTDKPNQTIYANGLSSPEAVKNSTAENLNETLNNLLKNLKGTTGQSSHAFLSKESRIKPGKQEKTENETQKTVLTSSSEKKLTTWLNGIISSDNADIKEYKLKSGANGFFWITWDAFSNSYNEQFQEKLENNFTRGTPNTFCPLTNLSSTRQVSFVDDNKQAIIKRKGKFDNEIKCGKKGFSSFLLPSDQPRGKPLRLICIEIPHLITLKAKNSFAQTTTPVTITLTTEMLNSYRKTQKEEDTEEKHATLKL